MIRWSPLDCGQKTTSFMLWATEQNLFLELHKSLIKSHTKTPRETIREPPPLGRDQCPTKPATTLFNISRWHFHVPLQNEVDKSRSPRPKARSRVWQRPFCAICRLEPHHHLSDYAMYAEARVKASLVGEESCFISMCASVCDLVK